MIIFLSIVVIALIVLIQARERIHEQERDLWLEMPDEAELECACEKTWEECYPTRRNWFELEEGTKQEWRVVMLTFWKNQAIEKGINQ